MNTFNFSVPQDITVGKGSLAKLPEIAKKLGKSKEDVTDLSDDDLREIAALANNALEQRAEESSTKENAGQGNPAPTSDEAGE